MKSLAVVNAFIAWQNASTISSWIPTGKFANSAILSVLGKWDLEQGWIGRFLCRVSRLAKTRGDPLLEVVFDLIANVLLEPADYETFMSEVSGV